MRHVMLGNPIVMFHFVLTVGWRIRRRHCWIVPRRWWVGSKVRGRHRRIGYMAFFRRVVVNRWKVSLVGVMFVGSRRVVMWRPRGIHWSRMWVRWSIVIIVRYTAIRVCARRFDNSGARLRAPPSSLSFQKLSVSGLIWC